MAKKTEIDSYEKLLYWLETMAIIHKDRRSGILQLKAFIEKKQQAGWRWEDIAEWANYSTAVATSDFNPFDDDTEILSKQ